MKNSRTFSNEIQIRDCCVVGWMIWVSVRNTKTKPRPSRTVPILHTDAELDLAAKFFFLLSVLSSNSIQFNHPESGGVYTYTWLVSFIIPTNRTTTYHYQYHEHTLSWLQISLLYLCCIQFHSYVKMTHILQVFTWCYLLLGVVGHHIVELDLHIQQICFDFDNTTVERMYLKALTYSELLVFF